MGESESDVGRDRLAEKWNGLATKDGQTIGKNKSKSVAIFAQWRLSGREAARGRFPIAATTCYKCL